MLIKFINFHIWNNGKGKEDINAELLFIRFGFDLDILITSKENSCNSVLFFLSLNSQLYNIFQMAAETVALSKSLLPSEAQFSIIKVGWQAPPKKIFLVLPFCDFMSKVTERAVSLSALFLDCLSAAFETIDSLDLGVLTCIVIVAASGHT